MSYVSELRWSRLPLLAKRTILCVLLCAMAWMSGAIDKAMFWHLLISLEVGCVAESILRSKRRVRRPAAFVAIDIALTVGLALYFAAVGVAVVLAMVDPLIATIPPASHAWVREEMRLRQAAIILTFPTTVFALVVVWRSRVDKIKLLDEMTRAIETTTRLLPQIESATDVEQAQAAGHRVIEQLVPPMLRPHGFFRATTLGQQSVRMALVFVPEADKFKLVCMWPTFPQYADLPKHLQPSVFNPAVVSALYEEHLQAVRQLRGDTLRAKEEEIRRRREESASITGHAFRYPGLHTYPDVTKAFFRSDAYLEAYAPEDRERRELKSKAAICLQIDGRRVGVLVLADTAVGGFMNADKSPIEMLAPLVALVLDRVAAKVAELERRKA